ncbi:auxin-responsive protein IAA23-like [Phragmites australis]|uniref:auxin-responsive protein IAA23-like n=1 Tax=Phragmites australis TaxID=29695 RepID=UPI002D76EAAC|nr:auxin-responsive protein IAA23-like [Phragmites australis]
MDAPLINGSFGDLINRACIPSAQASSGCKLMKVAMDGALYMPKVNLAAHDVYAALLHGIFTSNLAICGAGVHWVCRLVDSTTGVVPNYEDKDGNWMLVGDVPIPFKMFVDLCKRIHLMQSSEAVNQSPRTSS